ncbi:DUF4194 domain-containing protein [Planctomycetaceae bacterium SH139]
MIVDSETAYPEFRELGIAAVRLLQGAVYADDNETWDILLANQSELTAYFLKIGLVLVVDEPDGLAYLKQSTAEEQPPGYERLPTLFRRTTLGYDATLLCVLLRDAYRQFEDEDLDNERCVVELETLRDIWRTFFPAKLDDVQLQRRLLSAMAKLEKLKFVRPWQRNSQTWEVRRLLKSRLPIEQLEELRTQLLQAAEATANAPLDPESEKA